MLLAEADLDLRVISNHLKELKADRLDSILVRPEKGQYLSLRAVRNLVQAQRCGLTTHVGFSNVRPAQLLILAAEAKASGLTDRIHVQLPLSEELLSNVDEFRHIKQMLGLKWIAYNIVSYAMTRSADSMAACSSLLRHSLSRLESLHLIDKYLFGPTRLGHVDDLTRIIVPVGPTDNTNICK
jgi:hypothetical protein